MSLPRKDTIDKLKSIKRKFGKKGDIGDKVKYDSENLISDKSALKNVVSYEDFIKRNKKITR